MKPLIRSLDPDQLAQWPSLAGLPAFRARQLLQWIFGKGALHWDTMNNLPQTLRQVLSAEFDLPALEQDTRQVSSDGTRKFLFRLRDGQTVESVIIPMGDHATFCISSQVGCAMACRFCATARGGLVRNLEAGEILEQVLRLSRDLREAPWPGYGQKQPNVVFMGMGEPLDNWDQVGKAIQIMMHPDGLNISKRRIQLSTSGPQAGLEKLLGANPGIGLTLSLGGVTDESRRAIMPVPGRCGVDKAVALAGEYARRSNRRATLAWVLIKQQTDSAEQATRLASLANRGAFKVNLIPMNSLDDGKLVPPESSRVLAFQKILTDKGVPAFVRISGGQDIAAACGQLRRRRQNKPSS